MNSGYIKQKPIHTNNLLTVIRTDYTLSSFNQATNSISWNVTISEVMAIQKGSKNELAVNWQNENSNNLMRKITKLFENPNLNSIVSIHNYSPDSNLPIKIYDNKKLDDILDGDKFDITETKIKNLNNYYDYNSDIDFEYFLNSHKDKIFPSSYQNNNVGTGENAFSENPNILNQLQQYQRTPHYYDFRNREHNEGEYIKIDYTQIFKEYLNYTKNKFKENSKILKRNDWIGKLIYKFWEMYYFDQNFILYMTIFSVLLSIIILLIVIILKMGKKNLLLKEQLQENTRKLSNEFNDGSNHSFNITHNQEINGRKSSDIQQPNFFNKNYENQDDSTKNLIHLSTLYNNIRSDNRSNCNIPSEQCHINNEAICLYRENSFSKCLLENYEVDSHTNSHSHLDQNLLEDNKFFNFEKKLLSNGDSKEICIHNERKICHIDSSGQIKEISKQFLDLGLKEAEIKNKVEFDLVIYQDKDGKIFKEENKKTITELNNIPKVRETIEKVKEQLGLNNNSYSNNGKCGVNGNLSDEIKTDRNNFELNKSFDRNQSCNDFDLVKYKNYEKYYDNLDQMNNILEAKKKATFVENNNHLNKQPKNISYNKERSDFNKYDNKIASTNSVSELSSRKELIKFSIEAIEEKNNVQINFNNCNNLTNNNTKLDSVNNNSHMQRSRYVTLASNTDDHCYNNKNTIKSFINYENCLVLKQDFTSRNKFLSLDKCDHVDQKSAHEGKSNSPRNSKDCSSSKQTKNSPNPKKKNNNNLIYDTNENNNKKTNVYNNNISTSNNSPCISKKHNNNLNLKRKYKEYNILTDTKENSKLMKIDTTFINEGRIGKDFEEFSKIGEGGFGSVFKAKHKIDGSLYALKVIKLDVGISQSLREHKVIKEVKTMVKLNHKNVVRYYTCWFQLNVDEIKNLRKENESDEYDNTMNSNKNTLTNNSNFSRNKIIYNTIFSKKKNPFKYSIGNQNSESIYKHKNSKLGDIKNKGFNDYKYTLSESRVYLSEQSDYSRSLYISKSLNKYSNTEVNYISVNNKSNKKMNNKNTNINITKSICLNQISENGESDFNSKNSKSQNNSSVVGFNWDESNFLSKKFNKSRIIPDENKETSESKASNKRALSSKDSKSNSSHHKNKELSSNKINNIILSSVASQKFKNNNSINNNLSSRLSENNNKNFWESYYNNEENVIDKTEASKNRKLSSLTEYINSDCNLNDKKALSISLEKNEEEIFSNSGEDSYHISNERVKIPLNDNNKKESNKNNKISIINNSKNYAKKYARDDSVIDFTKRQKKIKKEFVYNVYFLVQMEFCDGLSLNQYLEINKNTGLPRLTIYSFFKQILSGVNQIHKSNIIHRDLK